MKNWIIALLVCVMYANITHAENRQECATDSECADRFGNGDPKSESGGCWITTLIASGSIDNSCRSRCRDRCFESAGTTYDDDFNRCRRNCADNATTRKEAKGCWKKCRQKARYAGKINLNRCLAECDSYCRRINR